MEPPDSLPGNGSNHKDATGGITSEKQKLPDWRIFAEMEFQVPLSSKWL